MAELIHIVQRHEETAKGPDGKKLDRPTPEGVAAAYRRGLELRAAYPEHDIRGMHSEANRAYVSCVGQLLGTGLFNEPMLERSLNKMETPGISEEARENLRNLPEDEFLEKVFNMFRHDLVNAGKRVAQYLVSNMDTALTYGVNDSIFVNITHGPVIDAAYLILRGLPLELEAMRSETGVFKEGTGFGLKLRETERGVFVAELGIGDNVVTYTKPLDTFRRNINETK